MSDPTPTAEALAAQFAVNRANAPPTSTRALAAHLGVSHGSLASWLYGTRRHPDGAEGMAAVFEAAGADPDEGRRLYAEMWPDAD